MFNAKYKKGMADAAKAYEGFGQKQEDALNHILEEVRQGKKSIVEAVSALNGNLDGLYDHLKSKKKASLYTVYTPFDIKELGDQERLFLLGALLRLTVDKTPNENQQNYIRAVQKYLEVKEPPFGVDLLAIENIEDVPSQKAILQTVLEYLRLQDGDGYDETELQQEFLDAFSVSNRVKNEIINHVELLYGATGAQGLAEKYGYVPEEEPEEIVEEDSPNDNNQIVSPMGDISMEVSDKIFQTVRTWYRDLSIYKMNDLLELDDYYLAMKSSEIGRDFYQCENSALYSISKKTGEWQFIFGKYAGYKEVDPEDFEEIERLIHLEEAGELEIALFSKYFWVSSRDLEHCVVDGNTAFCDEHEKIIMINVQSKTVEQVGQSIENYSLVAAKKPYLIFINHREKEIILFDYNTKKKHLLKLDKSLSIQEYDGMHNSIWVEDKLYAGYDRYDEGKCGIAVISPAEKQCKPMVMFDEDNIDIISIMYRDKVLYALARVGYHGNHRYNIYAVPFDYPSGYTIIKKNVTIDSYKMQACAKGWIFIENDADYSLKFFDFGQREFITLGTGCGQDGSVKLHFWSSPERTCNPYDFCVIGDSVYYEVNKGGSKKTIKTSLSAPSQIELID